MADAGPFGLGWSRGRLRVVRWHVAAPSRPIFHVLERAVRVLRQPLHLHPGVFFTFTWRVGVVARQSLRPVVNAAPVSAWIDECVGTWARGSGGWEFDSRWAHSGSRYESSVGDCSNFARFFLTPPTGGIP